jgi:hypothetical protein
MIDVITIGVTNLVTGAGRLAGSDLQRTHALWKMLENVKSAAH